MSSVHLSREVVVRWSLVCAALLVISGCTGSPHAGEGNGAGAMIPDDKALVTITYSRGATALGTTDVLTRTLPSGCIEANPETHVVTYLSYRLRDTVLIDTVEWRDEATFENVLFAPSGDAWVYVVTLHVPEGRPGVVLAGTRLAEPVTFVGGSAVTLDVDLDALERVELAWVEPFDAERPWTGGPRPYSYEPLGDDSEVGIRMEASLPWPVGDDSRAPAFGWENAVSYSNQNPTNAYYVFQVWESSELIARNLVDRPEDDGVFGVRVNGLGFNGASLAFPTRNFYTLHATCTNEHIFVVPERP